MAVVPNPILPGCFPDPSICRVGEEYFLVASTFEYLPGLPILRSRDLVHWELIGHAIDRPGMLDMDGMASSSGLYAPTLRFHDGVFWVLCTLVDQNDPARGGHFLLTASDPAGPWSEPHPLDAAGIDPSILFDDDGRAWVHGTRLAADPQWPDQTEIWLRELDRESLALIGDEHVIWNGAVVGAVWAEGPHLYRIDGAYYLLASEGGTEFHHAVCVARSDRVTGPYTGSRANPVLTHRHLGRDVDIVGVGHADLVQAVDGSWWAVLLGTRPGAGLGRETFLVPVSWQDGWPVFAPGSGRVPAEVDVPFAAAGERGAIQGGAGGVVRPDDPRWTSVRALPAEIARPAGDGWDLPLRPAALTEPTRVAFLGVRRQHRDADVSAVLDVDLRPGEEAGLVVRQSEDDHVRFFLTSSCASVVVVHRQAGEDQVLGEVCLHDDPGAGVELLLRLRGRDLEFSVRRPGGGAVVAAVADGGPLDSGTTGGFLGQWIGVGGTSNGAATDTVLHLPRFEYAGA